MIALNVHPISALCGEARVPGDKSISHRALLLGALGEGESHLQNFPASKDCLATVECLRNLGVEITISHARTETVIHGRGLKGLTPPQKELYCHRSATTMRLLTGILAGQEFNSTLSGDEQLLLRPMYRVTEPLRRMGAYIVDTEGRAPLTIFGKSLHSYVHRLDVPSAQVKSALLLAGLYADGPTTICQTKPTRDHTERMLAAMGANVEIDGLKVTISPLQSLKPLSLTVPGDLSSAAFLIVASIIVPQSEVTIFGVGSNSTRTGLLEILQTMGADISISNTRTWTNEPVSDITACTSNLHGAEISRDLTVRMIDEFPILAVAATQGEGIAAVRDVSELRIKESNRVRTVVQELLKLGADIKESVDGFMVKGPTQLHGNVVESHNDHRLAMALAVAGMIADSDVTVLNAECIKDSFPGFVEVMQGLGAKFD